MTAQDASTGERLWTVNEVAEYLVVDDGWVRDHSNGKRKPALPVVRVGKHLRYRRADIEAWVARNSSNVDAA